MIHAAAAIATGGTEGKRVSAFTQSTRLSIALKIFDSIPSPDASPVAMNINAPETNPAANHANFHKPDFPMSCSRRVVSAEVGIRTARPNSNPGRPVPRMRPMTAKTRPATKTNSHHHQYSARVARPPKLTYLRKPRATASTGPTIGLADVDDFGILSLVPVADHA